MASNALSYNDLAFPGYGVPNKLNPDGSFASPYQTTGAAQTASPIADPNASPSTAPSTVYPSWLTDLSARGLADDWLPAAFVADAPLQPQYRVIPPDPPFAAPDAMFAGNVVAGGPAFSSEGGPGGSVGDNGSVGSSGSGYGNDTADTDTDAGNAANAAAAVGVGDQANEANAVGATTSTDTASQSTSDQGAPAGDPSDAAAGNDSGSPGGGPGGGGGQGGDGSGPGGDSGSGGGGPGGGDSFFKGGMVTLNKLAPPNPPGPDDGYAALNKGEGVITAKAMRFYGPAFLAKINKLAVPKTIANARR